MDLGMKITVSVQKDGWKVKDLQLLDQPRGALGGDRKDIHPLHGVHLCENRHQPPTGAAGWRREDHQAGSQAIIQQRVVIRRVESMNLHRSVVSQKA